MLFSQWFLLVWHGNQGHRTGGRPGTDFRQQTPDCRKCCFSKGFVRFCVNRKIFSFLPGRDPAEKLVLPMVFNVFSFLPYFFLFFDRVIAYRPANRSHFHVIWVPDGFQMGSRWLPDDFQTTSRSIYVSSRIHSNTVNSRSSWDLRSLDEFQVSSRWVPDDFQMTARWLPDDFQMSRCAGFIHIGSDLGRIWAHLELV